MSANKHPPITWSQLRDTVSIIIGVQDAQDVHVDVIDAPHSSLVKISLKEPKEQQQFGCELTLFSAVEPALSSQENRARGIHLTLVKKRNSAGGDGVWFWPRLTLAKVKNPNITIDWNNWKDEEDLEKLASGSRSSNGMNFGGGGVDEALFSSSGGGGLHHHDDDDVVGGLSLESEEIQKTLAALRQEQFNLKKEALLMSGGSGGSEKERRKLLSELQSATMENELMKQVPKFGSAKDQVQVEDDEDELPPLV